MTMNTTPLFLRACLLARLCLPAIVFIGLCTGTLLVFGTILALVSEQITHDMVLNGLLWLSLLIFYIVFGIAFIRFNAHLIRRSFGSPSIAYPKTYGHSEWSSFLLPLLAILVSAHY